MTHAKSILSSILSGDLSAKSQGFLLQTPQGFDLSDVTRAALTEAYGTEHHPDIRIIAPGGKGDIISVDAIREAQMFLASTSSGKHLKTLLILSAGKMNDPAANALLKPLEEPGRQTRIILITDTPSALPATIRSRCAQYYASCTPQDGIAEVRSAMPDADLEDDAITAAMTAADGNPNLATAILQHDLQPWAKKLIEWLGSAQPTPPLPTLTGKTAVPLSIVSQVLQSILVQNARKDDVSKIEGWTSERASEAAWIAVCSLEDIRRAGIDSKTRLHSLLVRLRKETSPA